MKFYHKEGLFSLKFEICTYCLMFDISNIISFCYLCSFLLLVIVLVLFLYLVLYFCFVYY